MTATLAIQLPDTFSSNLATKVSIPGVRPVDAVEQILTETIIGSLSNSQSVQLLKPPSVRLHPMYFADRCATLFHLARDGYATWYVDLVFSSALESAVDNIDVVATGLELKPINYGLESHSYQLTTKRLKTQVNHVLRLNHVVIPRSVFSEVLSAVESLPPLEQPYVANPRPGPRSQGFEHGIADFEFVSFDHMVTGKRRVCSCSRTANDKMLATARGMTGQCSAGSWPHQVVSLLTDASYEDSVCHLCIARRSGPEMAGIVYGDAIQQFVAPYVNQLMLSDGTDKATARAEVQQTLGISRWVREAEMHGIVKKLFPDHVVMREASPSWLGRQRLDVFIPTLNLALEHQGEQHYRPVSAFGGEEALKRATERDEIKRRLCRENGVHLVEIGFDEPLTAATLRTRLRRYIH
ncbi:hypothetical protein ACFSE1_06100 [Rhizobium helianthi]|uniref:Uncharacterized protein n=1 Tax=Rhizobium helianthi TaxID=1132695 RepID=A0ABW4M1R0_9HYPH